MRRDQGYRGHGDALYLLDEHYGWLRQLIKSPRIPVLNVNVVAKGQRDVGRAVQLRRGS